jgi:LacI family transcriptional regulator
MAERGTTLRLIDVAERAGVSLATASRSLSGTTGVSDRVAERVRSVAVDMGYVANAHARSLAGGADRSVGLIVSEIGDPYFAEIASGVIGVATANQRTVQIGHAADPEAVLAQIRQLRAHQVGAIVLAGSGYADASLEAASNAELTAFQASGGRVVAIGRHHLAADAVLPDNVEAGRAIGAHLVGLGHRRIALVAGPAALNTVADRISGLLDVIGDAVVSVEHQEFSRAGGARGAAAVLEGHPEVTAIVALSDIMAIGVLATARERGIRVPDRLSVAGFDDIPVAADVAPGLTTVRIPMAELGAAAMRLALLDRASRPRRKETGHELVVRDSTAAPFSGAQE